MRKKTSAITGATSGIGFQTALQLAEMNYDTILLCRNESKGSDAKAEIMRQVPSAKVDVVLVDLSSQKQIREAAKKVSELAPTFDVLVNNAGMWASKRELTEDGIEMVFAVNHLAYFLLTHLLYKNLANSDDARIVNVSSDSHFNSPLYLNNLGLEGIYNGLKSYAHSKLANVLFTYEFDRIKPHDHVAINALQPGLVKTDIGLKDTTWLHALVWKIRRSGGVSPREGAATSVYLASSPEAKGQSGKYWDKCKPKPSSEHSYKENDAKQLWEKCEDMCGIENYFG